jgi:hypothetical protein
MSDDDLGKLFRELPDEDPPESGMSALMAAATAKAREMAPPKPSLFARFLETFKRPPVLAFATIVVLIGGVVIVKRHGEPVDLVAPATAPVPRAVGSPPPPPPVVDHHLDQVEHRPEVATPDPTPEIAQAKPEPRRTVPVAPPRPTPPPPKPQVATVTDEPASGDLAGEATVTPHVSPPPTAPPKGMAIASDDVAAAPRPVAKAPMPASAEQLLHECQSAANRGDCPAVRTIAGKIQTSNASFYRERVVKDAAIAKCL